MKRGLWLAIAAAGLVTQQSVNPRRTVQALVESGKLDDAERTARASGARLGGTLGEVLVSRGKLAAAESAYKATIAAGSIEKHIAEVGLAELAKRRGDYDDAFKRADALATAYERAPSPWNSDDQAATARAYLLLGAEKKWSDAALRAFDRAVAADSSNLDAMLRTGDLFMDKFQPGDAREQYDLVLKREPTNARALFGLAKVLDFQDSTDFQKVLIRALASNPKLVMAQVYAARSYLEAESYDSARVVARRALANDSSSVAAWAILGAAAYVTGDSAGFQTARAAAERLSSRPSEFYAELAEAAVRNRRYAEAIDLGRKAVSYDSLSMRALTIVGTNLLRAGDMRAGRAAIERAFVLDPYNPYNKNTLDMLDEMDKFVTVDRGHFKFVVPPGEADLLVMYLSPLLEEAYDTLSKRYAYSPPAPIRIEVFRRHADFSVRTIGLAGLGALGVTFGTVIAMDAPSARTKGDFNWGSTAWHELTHTFSLGSSGHRVPRWLSEGMSVFEERRARAGWGADASAEFLAAYKGGHVHKVSTLNDGFVNPQYPAETQYSYYDASLVCEMIFAEKGAAGFTGLLSAYRDGLDTRAAFQKVFGMTMGAFDAKYDQWLHERFLIPLRYIDAGDGPSAPKGEFVNETIEGGRLAREHKYDSARVVLERAQAMFPTYAGKAGPAWWLAVIKKEQGDVRGALDQISRITTQSETAWDANEMEAQLREQSGDRAGALAALDRMVWITPYDPDLHVRIANIAVANGDLKRGVRERRAILALNPSDRMEARYQLARALQASGDIAGARSEVLGILELAPGFEKAQALLLELRGKTP